MPAFNAADFSGNPVRLEAPRSRFLMNFKHKTTFNGGYCIPIFSYGDVLPGDTFSVDLSSLVRMTTPVFPTMDDAFLDIYFFFTPHKLTLSRRMMSPAVNDGEYSWNAIIGAQDSLLNMPTPGDYKLPFAFIEKKLSGVSAPAEIGSLTDYLGIGLVQGNRGISCLEPLAYYCVWNNYFRDENTMNPVCYSLNGAFTASGSDPNIVGRKSISLSGYDGNARWGDGGSYLGFKDSILPACRPHGYFGSALPWPQRNTTAVTLPLGDIAPVYASGSITNDVSGSDVGALRFKGDYNGSGSFSSDPSQVLDLYYTPTKKTTGSIDTGTVTADASLTPSNLVADLKAATAASINAIRYAFASQKFFEALARGGNRIGEMTASMFGVTPSDLAQDRPEYLGGKRIPISIDQVANTAGPNAGGSGQTLGSLGAYSNTGDSSHYFTKSFDTWGTITCIAVVRTNESFSQGMPKRYKRAGKLDFYWPQFANIGEQPVLKQELWMTGGGYNAGESAVFGYQEAWAEYRYLPDIVSGYLRPAASLGAYTYSNDFGNSAPTLAGYLKGDGVKTNIDRTLIVPSTSAGFQFMGDFAFKMVVTRAMPRYSVPGLIDHY